LALGAAIVAASAPSRAQLVIEPSPMPAPYNYYGPNPYYYGPGTTDGPGACYEDSLYGRVCRD
jgi:hypothetical protein